MAQLCGSIRRMEVHENATPIIGFKGHTAHQISFKNCKTFFNYSYQISSKKITNARGRYLDKDMGPEAKLYQKLRKKSSKGILWTRLENISSLGHS